MQIGAAMFFTEYSMAAAELAQALEARGFESVWAPEHSHVPLSRQSPFPSGGQRSTPNEAGISAMVRSVAADSAVRNGLA